MGKSGYACKSDAHQKRHARKGLSEAGPKQAIIDGAMMPRPLEHARPL